MAAEDEETLCFWGGILRFAQNDNPMPLFRDL